MPRRHEDDFPDDYPRRPPALREDDYDEPRYRRAYDYELPPRRPRRAARSRLMCRDIMTREVVTAAPAATVAAVAVLMRDEDTGIIPIVEDGNLLGVVSDRDLVVRVVAAGLDANATPAREVMSANLHTAQPGDRVIEAIRKMGDKQVRRIPVIDETGHLRGIISMADIALETEVDRELAEALEDISSGASFWKKLY
jgi:CBS domain-containing protein